VFVQDADSFTNLIRFPSLESRIAMYICWLLDRRSTNAAAIYEKFELNLTDTVSY
jgi:hypothetical protein